MISSDKADKYHRAIDLKAEGLSVSAIAREVGESRQLVDYWLKGGRPRVLSDKSKATRREYMRTYMSKKRRDERVARLMS